MGKRVRKYLTMAMGLFLLLSSSFYYLSGFVTVSNNVNGKELPISSVKTEEKKLALTFNTAWNVTYLDEILQILEAHSCKATFFVMGEWTGKHPEELKKIVAAGHETGNLSYDHKNMTQLSEEEQRNEIAKTHKQVKELTGKDMKVFRMPYGAYDDTVIKSVTGQEYIPVQWSVDSKDWKDYGADEIVKEVLENKNLQNGAIILCHTNAKYTKDALDVLLEKLEEKGYQIVPVSQMLYEEPYHLDVTGRQIQDN